MNNYDDIINLPHHQSPSRPRMSMQARAAQFAPFAALPSLASLIDNTAENHISLLNSPQHESDFLLSLLSENIPIDYE